MAGSGWFQGSDWLRGGGRFCSGTPLVACLVVLALSAGTPLRGQSGDGLGAVAAVQQRFIDVIAENEASVVAITLVRKTEEGVPGPFVGPLNQLNARPALPSLDDPTFMFNEFGTGVVIDADGLILTNFHVLHENHDVFVTTVDRKVHAATVRAADPRSDLAVLKIDASGLRPMPLGDGGKLKKGQLVVALGNPYAIASDGEVSASWGIISNLARKAAPLINPEDGQTRPTLHHFGTLIQTDAKLTFGTSGGALLDMEGKMIGLTTSLAAITGYEQAAGYAVPVDDTFRRVVDALKEGREVEYGLLGVRMSPALARRATPAQDVAGWLVEDIERGSPAQRAGLVSGDVITKVAGAPIVDFDDLAREVGRLPAAATARLTVWRRGRAVPVDVVLAKYPVMGRKVVTRRPRSWRGMQIDYGSAVRSAQPLVFAPPELSEPHVVVTELAEESAAARAGLQVGARISRVDDRRVETPAEFRRAVRDVDGAVRLTLIVPSGIPETVTIPAE